MLRLVACGAAACLSCAGLVQPAVRAQAPTFTSQVEVVMLNVTVTDPHGRLVRGLGQSDFTVLEDGRPQATMFFASGNVPLDLELLIDTSSSMRLTLPVAKTVAGNFLGKLRPQDQAAIAAVTERLTVVQSLTSDVSRLREALKQLVANGGTSLYTSLYITLRQLASHATRQAAARRSAIILLTDGKDTTSLTSFDDLLDEARRSNVAIYPIAIGLSLRFGAAEEGGNESRFHGPSDYALSRLAAESGARAFFPNQLVDLAGVYDAIAHELATQYSIAYARTTGAADSTYHRLTVRLNSLPDATSRTRLGFYAGRFGQAMINAFDRK